jgi:hypothetical protein
MKKRLGFLLVTVMFIVTSTFAQVSSLSEDFSNTSSLPTDWTTINGSSYNHWGASSSYGGCALISYGDGIDDYLITPQIAVGSNYTLTFKVKASFPSWAYATTLTVEVSTTDATAAGNFTPIDTVDLSICSDFTEFTVNLNDYANQNIYIAFHDVDEDGTGVYLDDVEVFNNSCPKPADIVTNMAATTGTISWTGTGTAYDFNYKVDGEEDWTELTNQVSPINLTNLTSGTKYAYQLRNNCGTDQSAWVEGNFSTITEPITVNGSVTIDFEGDTYNSYFSNGSSNGDAWVIGSAVGNTGNSLYISNDNGTTNASNLTAGTDVISSVALTFGDYAEQNISFDYKNYGGTYSWGTYYNNSLSVYLVPSSVEVPESGAPSGTGVKTLLDSKYGISDWTTYSGTFTDLANSTWTLVFRQSLQNSYSYYTSNPPAAIDNIVISESNCAKPTDVALAADEDAQEQTSLKITWSQSGTVSSWNVYYRAQGTTEWSDAQNVAYTSETPEATITGLSANTSYEIKVTAVCNGEETIGATNTLRTACGDVTIADDGTWTDGFEAIDSSNKPACWTTVQDASGYPNAVVYAPAARTGTNALEFKSGDCMIAFPYIPEVSEKTLRLKFYHRENAYSASYAGHLYVGVIAKDSINSATAFEQIVEVEPHYGDGTSSFSDVEEIYLNSFTTEGDVYIAFKYVSASSYYSWYIDDITIDHIPSCAAISKKSVTAVDSTIDAYSATINFTDGDDTHTSWKVYYREEGDTVNTPLVSTAVSAVADTTNLYEVELSDLKADTRYEVWVTVACSEDEESEPSVVYSFRTACAPLASTDIPYNNAFSDEGSVICWTLASTTGEKTWESDALRIYATSDGSATIVTSPQLVPDINTLRIKFSYKKYDYYSSYASAKLIVGVMSDPNNIGTFETLQTINVTNTDAKKTSVNLNNTQYITGANNYIAFRVISNQDGSYSYYNSATVYIDDVEISLIPDCLSPDMASVEVKNITHNSAKVTFTDSKATNDTWQVYLRNMSDSTITDQTVSSKDPVITGLTANTTYEVWIKTVCNDDGAVSEDSTNIVTFTTKTVPVAIPYNQTFEDDATSLATTDFAMLGNSNQWNVGTNQKKDGEKGMYVTTGSGESSTYCYATATVNVEFDENPEQVVTFDYKAFGSSYSYNSGLKVYLLPSSVVVENGEQDSQYLIGDFSSVSDWTNFEYVTNDFTNQTAQLVFVGYAYAGWSGSSYATGSTAIDNLSVYSNACARPSNITKAIDDQSITLSWTDNAPEGSTTSISYAKIDTVETTFTTVTATSNPYTIDGLDAESKYQVVLSVDCGDDGTNSVDTMIIGTTTSNFVMAGATATTIDFEDSTAYTMTTVASGINKWIVGTKAYDSTVVNNHALYVSDDDSSFHYNTTAYSYSTKYSTFATIPVKFGGDNLNEYEISFDYRVGGNSNSKFSAYLVPADVELAYNNQIDESNAYVLTKDVSGITDWTNVMTIAQGVQGVYNLVFEWRYTDYTYYVNNPPSAVDNIKIQGYECRRPNSLNYDSVTTTKVYLTWKEAGTTDTWKLYYGINKDSLSSVVEVNSTNSTYNAATKTVYYTADSLLSGAKYYFKVASICGEESQPTSILKASTLGTRVDEFPYFLSFENSLENNTFTITGTGVNQFVIGDAAGVDDQYGDGWTHHALYLSNDEGETFAWSGNVDGTTSDAYATMQILFGSEDEYSIDFDYITSGYETKNCLKVYLKDENGVQTQIMPNTLGYGINAWTHFQYKTTGVKNGAYDLIFYWHNGTSDHINPGAAIDNISIVGSSCTSVDTLRVEKGRKTYTNSLPVRWYDNNPEHTSWTVVYNEANSNATTIVVEDTNILLTGLNSSARYEIRVYANCISGEDTTLSVPVYVSAYTDCPPIASGWSDAFDIQKYNNRQIPACWVRLYTYNGADAVAGTVPYPSIITYAGTGHVQGSDLSTGGTGDATSMEWKGKGIMATPYFENIESSIFTYYGFRNGYASTEEGAGIWIYVADDIYDSTTWEPIKFIKNSDLGNWNYHNNSFGGQIKIPMNNIISTGTKAIVMDYYNDGNTGGSLYLDDFRMLPNAETETPCNNNLVLSLTDGEINDEDGLLYTSTSDSTTATVTWTNPDNARIFDYKIDIHGHWITTALGDSCTATFTDLTPGTEHTIYVRAHCYDINNIYNDDSTQVTGYDTVENGNVSAWKSITFTLSGENPLFCPEVTSVVVDSVSDVTVQVSWTIEGAFAQGVDIMLTEDDDPMYNAYDGKYTTVGDTVSTYTFTTTSEGYAIKQLTSYNVYIRSHCAQSTSEWDTVHATTLKTKFYPTVQTNSANLGDATSFTAATVTLKGAANQQDYTINERGFYYYETNSPITQTSVVSQDETYNFSATLTTLKPSTSYTYFAYVKIAEDTLTFFGDPQTFTTATYIPVKPTLAVTTDSITDHSVKFNGTFTVTDENIVTKGFVFYRANDPTNTTDITVAGAATTAKVDTLKDNTTYKVYAYATTNYYTTAVTSDTVTFTTDANAQTIIDPVVVANAATGVDTVKATLSATVTETGTLPIKGIGFIYNIKGTSSMDTITMATTEMDNSGAFSKQVTGLTKNKNYEYVAWVKTDSGMFTSAKINFKTAEGQFVAPQITTLDADAIDDSHATLSATLVPGSKDITAKGFVYAKQGESDSTTVVSTTVGNNFTYNLVNLSAGTTYNYRAFVTTEGDSNYYGEEKSFTTTGGIVITYPTVQTYDATNVAQTSATLNGRVDETNSTVTVTEKGFAYKVQGSTTVMEKVVTSTNAQFSDVVTDLTAATEYVYYTYAKIGTDTIIKGEEKTFTTVAAAVVEPTVATGNAESTKNSITLHATVTLGTKDITASGFNYRESGLNAWQTVEATISDGSMMATVEGLNPETTYEYQAFITTEDGTITGDVKSVITLKDGALIDVTDANSMVVYPNPTTDNAVLRVEGLDADAQVILVDVSGRVISTSVLAKGQTTMTIKMESLNAGTYYVRVVNDNFTKTMSLIKK